MDADGDNGNACECDEGRSLRCVALNARMSRCAKRLAGDGSGSALDDDDDDEEEDDEDDDDEDGMVCACVAGRELDGSVARVAASKEATDSGSAVAPSALTPSAV
jgi:hypothetical protein